MTKLTATIILVSKFEKKKKRAGPKALVRAAHKMAAPSILGNPRSRQEHAAQAAAMRDTLRLGRRCCCRWPAAPALRPLPHSAPTCPSTVGLLRPAGKPPAHSTPLALSAPPPLTRRPQRTPAAHRPGSVCGAPVVPPSRFGPHTPSP